MKELLTIFFAFFALTMVSGQVSEICDDNIDNDVDILTDCADPDCTGSRCLEAFPCSNVSQLYQYADGLLYEYIDQAWVQVVGWQGDNTIALNAMGYNVEDGFIYGINNNNGDLVKVTRSGMDVIGSVGIGPSSGVSNFGGWYTGDMDLDGNLYVSGASQDEMYIVDVSNSSSSEILFTGSLGLDNQLDVSDWAFLPATQRLYGVDRDNSLNLRVIGLDGFIYPDISLSNINCNGGFGAMFADANGNLYASCNSSGEFFRLVPNGDFTAFTVESLVVTQSWTRNDGAGCPLANGIDDDCCKICDEKVKIIYYNESRDKSESLMEKELSGILYKSNGKATLFQNSPNPFNERTRIKYEILSKDVNSVFIYVYDLNGKLHLTYSITESKEGEIVLDGHTLEAGVYLYSIVIDDVIADTKKLILID